MNGHESRQSVLKAACCLGWVSQLLVQKWSEALKASGHHPALSKDTGMSIVLVTHRGKIAF